VKEIGVTVDNHSTQEKIPHVKNVDLVPDSRSHADAPGFNTAHSFGLSLGFLMMILIAYLVFG
jgi:hypothetical protein